MIFLTINWLPMFKNSPLTILSLIFIFFSVSSLAQVDQQKIDAEFSRAVELYNVTEYDSAFSGFGKIINEYDLNSKTTAAYFFTIKILIEKNEYESAEKLITEHNIASSVTYRNVILFIRI
jgi:hypothetical protein